MNKIYLKHTDLLNIYGDNHGQLSDRSFYDKEKHELAQIIRQDDNFFMKIKLLIPKEKSGILTMKYSQEPEIDFLNEYADRVFAEKKDEVIQSLIKKEINSMPKVDD